MEVLITRQRGGLDAAFFKLLWPLVQFVVSSLLRSSAIDCLGIKLVFEPPIDLRVNWDVDVAWPSVLSHLSLHFDCTGSHTHRSPLRRNASAVHTLSG